MSLKEKEQLLRVKTPLPSVNCFSLRRDHYTRYFEDSFCGGTYSILLRAVPAISDTARGPAGAEGNFPFTFVLRPMALGLKTQIMLRGLRLKLLPGVVHYPLVPAL